MADLVQIYLADEKAPGRMQPTTLIVLVHKGTGAVHVRERQGWFPFGPTTETIIPRAAVAAIKEKA